MSVLHICALLASVAVSSHAATMSPVNTRLVGGTQYVGRVEVYYGGVWGTVCDDSFDDIDAQVVCYSLGFGYVGHAYCCANYGLGSGQIWMDDVACTGTETSIFNCAHNGWGSHNCQHSEDVAVDCSAYNSTIAPPTTTTTTPAPTNPPIPSPFTELSHEAEMVALDMSMTPSCLNQYNDQFKLTLDAELERAEQVILSKPEFCPGAHDVTLRQTSVNMVAMNNNVYLNFDVDLVTQGTETMNSITSCTIQLGDYLADFNNWKQPIWSDIYGCSRLQFTSGQFNMTNAAWKCP